MRSYLPKVRTLVYRLTIDTGKPYPAELYRVTSALPFLAERLSSHHLIRFVIRVQGFGTDWQVLLAKECIAGYVTKQTYHEALVNLVTAVQATKPGRHRTLKLHLVLDQDGINNSAIILGSNHIRIDERAASEIVGFAIG